MERFSHRESVPLGYSPQRYLNDPVSSPKSLCKDSDIDFNDVFGGPPRRASIQEMRCCFGESAETYSLRRASDGETSSYRLRLSGLGEKPVFGEEGVHRRRYPNEDFFGDIFKGNESLSSSPRKNDRDPFSSSPGSGILSPVRPLPPRVESFASSSLPAQFSLPGKLIKGTNLPAIRSSARNHLKNKDGTSNGMSFYLNSPLSRFSSPANQVQEESGNDVYFQSSLTEDLSNSSEDSSSLVKPDNGSNLKKDSNGSEVPTISNQFHFSIYKWASKGIPLALPRRGGNSSKSKEKIKFERSSSASGRIACEGMAKELPAETPQDIEIKLDKKESGFLLNLSNHGRVEGRTIKEAALPKSETDGPDVIHFQNTKETKKPHSILETGLFGKTEERIFSVPSQEAPKNELKTLHSLLLGSDEIAIKNEIKESKGKSIKKSAAVFDDSEKFKKQDGKATQLNSEETDKADFKGSPIKSQDVLAKNQGRGKVKEFVKIFNQEASNKPKFSGYSQIQSSGWKERGKSRTQNDVSVTTSKANDKVLFADANMNNTPQASVVVEGFLKQSEKQHSETRTHNNKSTDISSELTDTPASITASIPEGSEVIVGDLDDSFQGNILIKELPQHEDELPEAGDSQDKIQVIDAKICKWSNGKEWNIRSLLSTLQYVLWPESGWKPVPLVDIIEGNAVKRSYQKALLSLHPDKLQQKGATLHQKYIAEKVFNILQEAWTHFNSVGSV